MSDEPEDKELRAILDACFAGPPSRHTLYLLGCDANDLSLDDIRARDVLRPKPVKGFWKQLPKYRRRKKQ